MGGRDDRQAAGKSHPVPRGDRHPRKRRLIEIKPYRGFYVRSFSRDETADLYELYKRLECFAVELAVPQMSDCAIRRFENILL